MHYLNPFSQPGQWYRGNTHTHSSLSDGVYSVEELCRGYRQQNYDFLVVTDHGKINDVRQYSDEKFLVISGSELHPSNPYGGTMYHIVAINIHKEIEVAKKHANEVMAIIAEQGGISVLAHPYWSGHTLLDFLPLRGYFAVEVFNSTCGSVGRSIAESQWDILLDRVAPVFGIACDDAHVLSDAYQGWIMVKSSELSLNSIMNSMTKGLFYSTQGPEIYDFRLEESTNHDPKACNHTTKRIIAQFSPSVSVVFNASPSMGKHIRVNNDQYVTEAFYDLKGDEKYVRLEITASDGKKAWVQPITIARE